MTAQQPQRERRCVLTMHEVQVIKDLIFVISGNAESGSQKVIFEMLADGVREATRPHTPAPLENVDGCRCLGCKVEDKGNGEPEYCLPIRNSIDRAAQAATLAAQKDERHQMLLRDIASRKTLEKYPVFIQGLGWLSFDMAWESLQSLRQSTTAQEDKL
jgi:hypothetical protein